MEICRPDSGDNLGIARVWCLVVLGIKSKQMKSEMDDIVFRLRHAVVREPKMPSENFATTLGKQAADRIAELEDRIATLNNIIGTINHHQAGISECLARWIVGLSTGPESSDREQADD